MLSTVICTTLEMLLSVSRLFALCLAAGEENESATNRLCGNHSSLLLKYDCIQTTGELLSVEWMAKLYLQTLKFDFHMIFVCHEIVFFLFFKNHLKL